MFRYNYNGIKFSSETELSPDELDEVLSSFEEKEEDGLLTSVGKGLASGFARGGNMTAMGAGQAGLGAMELMSKLDSSASGKSPSISDEAKQSVVGFIEGQDKFYDENDPLKGNDSVAGKVAAGVGMLPYFLNPITAPFAIAGSGAETGRRHIRDGGTVAGAQTALAADTGLAAASIALPASLVTGKTLNAAATSGLFAGQELLNRKAQQGIRHLEANGMEQLPDLTGGDLAASAIIGGGLGHMMGKNKAPSKAKEPVQEAPPEVTPAKAVPIVERFRDLKENAILEKERLVVTYEKKLADIEKDIASGDVEPHDGLLAEQRNQIKTLRDEIDALRGIKKEEPEAPIVKEEEVPPKAEEAPVKKEEMPEELTTFLKPIRDDISNDPSLDIPGHNSYTGIKRINLEKIKDYFAGMSEKKKNNWGIHSERALQIFVELHETAHDFVHPTEGETVASHERRVNQEVWDFWRTIKDERKVSRQAIQDFGKGRVTDVPVEAYLGDKVRRDYDAEHAAANRAEQSVKDADNVEGPLETPRELPDRNDPKNLYKEEGPSAEEIDKIPYSSNLLYKTRSSAYKETQYRLSKAERWLEHVRQRLENHTNPNEKNTPEQLQEMVKKAEQAVDRIQAQMDHLLKFEDQVNTSKKSQKYTQHDDADLYTEENRSDHETIFRGRDEYVEQLQKNGMSKEAANAEADKWFPKDDPNFEGYEFSLDGEVPRKAIQAIGKIVSGESKTPFGVKVKTAEDAIKLTQHKPDIPWLTSRLFSHIFGRLGFARIYQDVPAINFVNNMIQEAKVRGEHFVNTAWNGETAQIYKDWQGKVIKPLKAMVAMDSPSAVLEKISDKSIVKLMTEVFPDGYREGRPYHETLSIWRDRLTPDEIQAFTTLSQLFRKLSLGIQHTRKGWFPAVRRGDFMVKIHSNGVIWYAEMFRSEAEARNFINKAAKILPEGDIVSSPINLKEAKLNQSMDFQFAIELADTIATEIAPQKQKEIADLVKNKLGKQDPYSKHNKPRYNIAGYEGNKLFGDDASTAHQWKKAIHFAVDEKGAALTRGIINAKTSSLFDVTNPVSHYNSVEAAKILRDMATGKIKSKTEGFDTTITDSFDRLAVYMARKMGAKEWFPEVPVWDRVTGISTRLFYIRTLTSRPAFWLAQAITSPLSIRDMMRTSSVADALLYSGKGTMNILYGGSSDFKHAMLWAAQNTETFHPNFINDLNKLVTQDSKKFGNSVFEILSGEKFATSADSFSRYWTYSMMYERFKGEGFRGKELYKKAAEATDSTMILYSAKEKAPIFKQAGTVGQLSSPLLTFSQGALANFVADFRFMAKTGNPAPLAATFLMQVLLGGLIGAPLVAEWEFFRLALIKAAPDLEEYLPSIMEIAMSDSTPDVISHGAPSAMSGFDIGSGTRWNPIFNGILTGQKAFLSLESFPALNWAADTAGSVGTVAKSVVSDNIPKGQLRDAMFKTAPFSYMTPAIDRISFNSGDRSFVPDSKHGLPIVPQTVREEVAQGMGTKTMERAKAEKSLFLGKKSQEIRRDRVAKLYDLLSDRLEAGDDPSEVVQKLIKENVSPEEILSRIKSRSILNNRSAVERFKFGSSKTPSKTGSAINKRSLMENFKGE